MNEAVCYLLFVIDHRIDRVRDLKNEYGWRIWRKWSDFDKGWLAGEYAVIGKLFDRLASMGVFESLPVSLQQSITSSSLVEDVARGELANVRLLGDAFMKRPREGAYKPLDLRALFEEIITEGILLQGKKSEFDEGKLASYSFGLLTLHNQAEILVPKLFYSLPRKLRNFVPEHLCCVKKSDLGL
ncbi:MAG: hypothetical protein MUC61_03260 [Amoebophilaceae bacterium]|jgi:hypothetical protein|nr:hypothetical protein [Amoebophilaceae bacterium]